jgi:hypothetical protein
MAFQVKYDSASKKALFTSAQHCNLDFIYPKSLINHNSKIVCANPKTKREVVFKLDKVLFSGYNSYSAYHYKEKTLGETLGITSNPNRETMDQGFVNLRSDDLTIFSATKVSGTYQKSYWPFQIDIAANVQEYAQFFERGNRINNGTYHEIREHPYYFKFKGKDELTYRVNLKVDQYVAYRLNPQNSCYVFSNLKNPSPKLNQKVRQLTESEKDNVYFVTRKDIGKTGISNFDRGVIGHIADGYQMTFRGDSGGQICCLDQSNDKRCVAMGSFSSIEALSGKIYNGTFWTAYGSRFLNLINKFKNQL